MNARGITPVLALVTAGCSGSITTVPPDDCCSPSCCAPPPSTVECLSDGACLTTLVSGAASKGSIAVDATSVYWVENGDTPAVKKVPLRGGEPTTLVSGSPVALVTIALDAKNVYYVGTAADAGVFTCAIEGCGGVPTLLAKSPDGVPGPVHVAVDGADVYWTTNGGNTVMKCGTNGCGGAPTTLIGEPYEVLGVALDDEYVYEPVFPELGNDGVLARCKKSGCGGASMPVISGLREVLTLAVDHTNIYWSEHDPTTDPVIDNVRACVKADCTSPVPLGWAQNDDGGAPNSMVVDDENVYWSVAGGGGVVRKCAKTGCDFPPNPTDVATFPAGGGWLAVDATSLYYATDHAIMKRTPK